MQVRIWVCVLALGIWGFSLSGCNRHRPTQRIDSRPQPSQRLDFKLVPTPVVHAGSHAIPVAAIQSFIAQQKGASLRWVLYLPDEVPIDTALDVFRQFADAGCAHISVYAADARGDWPKRDIGVEVGPNDSMRVVTEFAERYPDALKIYLGNDAENKLLVAKCSLPELGAVLPPLLALSPRKHVRIVESGTESGTPAQRYLQVLEELKRVGVSTVSFFGVYRE